MEHLTVSRLTDMMDRLEGGKRDERRRRHAGTAEAFRLAAEKALVLRGPGAALDPLALREFLPPGIALPSARQLRRHTGGVGRTWSRIRGHNPFEQGELGVWNADFALGLRLNGALQRHPLYPRRWRIRPAGARPWLERDLEELPVAGRLSGYTECACGYSERRLTRCPLMDLPASDPSGPPTLGGLLAGSRLHMLDDEHWCCLPSSEAVELLLSDWSIPFRRAKVGGHGRILVSPFFAALVSPHMPCYSAGFLTRAPSPAMCPLLPAIYWRMAMGRKRARTMPRPDSLPYGCSRSTETRRGWNRETLRQIAWHELGIVHVDQRLRELMVQWHVGQEEI